MEGGRGRAQKGGPFDVVTPSFSDGSWSTVAPRAEPVLRPPPSACRTPRQSKQSLKDMAFVCANFSMSCMKLNSRS